jgi:hypothetical protein
VQRVFVTANDLGRAGGLAVVVDYVSTSPGTK